MIVKTVEIRDRGTFIPALAIKLGAVTEQDRYLLGRAGYGTTPDRPQYVILMRLAGGAGRATSDPHDWGSNARTMPQVHRWLIAHFDEIESGAVVDVEYILGESSAPKRSESET